MPLIPKQSLDADTIASLLQKSSSRSTTPKKQDEPKARRPDTPEEIAWREKLVRNADAHARFGPLRYYEKEGTCTHSSVFQSGRRNNCRAPTHMKLKGMYRCSVHALMEMNLMLHDLGVE